MKVAAFVVILAIPFWVACEGRELEEGVGGTDYFVRNRTSQSATIRWTESVRLGHDKRTGGIIGAGKTKKFAYDEIVGANPRPRDTLWGFWLDGEDGVPLFQHYPVENDAWLVERTDDRIYGHAKVTLIVTDADVAPDFGLPEGVCCCQYISGGDIIEEDAFSVEACHELPYGECIVVDPGRGTPHTCCPNATGERCSS